jgi:hypothetical protein
MSVMSDPRRHKSLGVRLGLHCVLPLWTARYDDEHGCTIVRRNENHRLCTRVRAHSTYSKTAKILAETETTWSVVSTPLGTGRLLEKGHCTFTRIKNATRMNDHDSKQ